ncbi:MAG: hypothetical protein AB7K35_05390 [Pseudorhodoplanes sp.]
MPAFLYKCPVTGHQVQGWVAEFVPREEPDSHRAITCLACRQLHFVQPSTGTVLGAREA